MWLQHAEAVQVVDVVIESIYRTENQLFCDRLGENIGVFLEFVTTMVMLRATVRMYN
jgi:hypothetical protein